MTSNFNEVTAGFDNTEAAFGLSLCSGWHVFRAYMNSLPAYKLLIEWAEHSKQSGARELCAWIARNESPRTDVFQEARRELRLCAALLVFVDCPVLLSGDGGIPHSTPSVRVDVRGSMWVKHASQLLNSVVAARSFSPLHGLQELRFLGSDYHASVDVLAESRLRDGRPLVAIRARRPAESFFFVCLGFWGRGSARRGSTTWDGFEVPCFEKWVISEMPRGMAEDCVKNPSLLNERQRQSFRKNTYVGTRLSSAPSTMQAHLAVDAVYLPQESANPDVWRDPTQLNELPTFVWP